MRPLKRDGKLFYLLLSVNTLIGVLILSGPVTGHAQEFWATDEGLEITGLILDETKTKPGHDFYDYFNTYWKEVKGLNYTITIKELPDTTRGSFIFVNVNDTAVYRQRLNPRPDVIEEAAKRAVNRANYYLLRKMATQKRLEEEFQY